MSCIYGIGAVETYSEMVLKLNTESEIERNILLKRLVELQYKRNDQAFFRGAFRARGDTIEIFPSHMEDRAWRISLFGDAIETIWEIDPLTGDKIGYADEVTIYPNSHYVTPRPTLLQAIPKIREELKTEKSIIHAFDTGYSKAKITVLDANITTLIAAIILFAFGSGPVKGFAITLGIGIITTLFTAYFLARHLTSLVVLNTKNKEIKI